LSKRKHVFLALLVAAATPGPASADPIIAYVAGDVAECSGKPPGRSGAADTARLIPAGSLVLVPGDTTYPFATTAALQSCYEPTWGAFRATTLVVPGNHDYVNGQSDDFRAYFGAGASDAGYFAKRLGGWLVIGLDSQRTGEALDGQYQWLEQTLEENRDVQCTLAFWHMPTYSSGLEHGPTPKMQRFWAALEAHHVEFVLNGHEHFYEAFGPLDGNGQVADDGMREFVVGTGGAHLYPIWNPFHLSRVRIARHGVLKLTLEDDSYSWQFIDVGGRVRDAGEARCRP
jgi:3',5'-cyclic AMP phosphodiesterase CpdA